MKNNVVIVALGILTLATQGCAASRAVSDSALRAVGVAPTNATDADAKAQADGDHWSEDWVWKGDKL
ncbi:MAG: hypothetical protein HRU11_04535 [Parvularculaceae bacterium]|nr:hypothetical protein [Parvularculaceae bacterium]